MNRGLQTHLTGLGVRCLGNDACGRPLGNNHNPLRDFLIFLSLKGFIQNPLILGVQTAPSLRETLRSMWEASPPHLDREATRREESVWTPRRGGFGEKPAKLRGLEETFQRVRPPAMGPSSFAGVLRGPLQVDRFSVEPFSRNLTLNPSSSLDPSPPNPNTSPQPGPQQPAFPTPKPRPQIPQPEPTHRWEGPKNQQNKKTI